MKDLKDMTITELTQVLNGLTGKNVKKAKGSRIDIIARIHDLQATQPKPKRKRGPSTKEVLRKLFTDDADAAFTLDELHDICNTVKRNTVETAIIDLKNPRWAVGSVLVLERGEDGKFRRAD